jgi:prepilin-type N-terminal cleavage/methylation domain-containing protein
MIVKALRAIGSRLRAADGVTLSEMLVVLVILLVILAGTTTLFISASNSQIDQTNRVRSQQEARLALDSLRREIHCASTVTVGSLPATSLTIGLGSYCPTQAGAPSVTWCTQQIVSGQQYVLWRYAAASVANCGVTAGGVPKADFLTTGAVFTAYTPKDTVNRTLASLTVSLPVDVTPADAKQRYTLTDDIVLRNSGRS